MPQHLKHVTTLPCEMSVFKKNCHARKVIEANWIEFSQFSAYSSHGVLCWQFLEHISDIQAQQQQRDEQAYQDAELQLQRPKTPVRIWRHQHRPVSAVCCLCLHHFCGIYSIRLQLIGLICDILLFSVVVVFHWLVAAGIIFETVHLKYFLISKSRCRST